MEEKRDLDWALDEVTANSAGGAPFLIAFGGTFVIVALLSFFLPLRTAAILAMFQGAVALPVAFLLERRMGSKRMSADNPLRALSAQLAMSQALGLPATIIAYSLDPKTVPAVLAAIGGVHFFPYAWLHRTRLYIIMACAISIGAFLLLLFLQDGEFTVTMFYIGIVYWIMTPLVFRHARRLL